MNSKIIFSSKLFLSQQCIDSFYEVQKFATLLSNYKFSNLKTLKIYFSIWPLENDKHYNTICTTLMKLPKLSIFTAVISYIQSDVNFRSLGNRFKAVIDTEWINNEQWQ